MLFSCTYRDRAGREKGGDREKGRERERDLQNWKLQDPIYQQDKEFPK